MTSAPKRQPAWIRHRFRAMGCAADVVVVAGTGREATELAERGERRIEHLEHCWSRFLPNSDVSRVNESGGATVAVDAATITLVQMMGAGALATEGAYNPTLLGSIVGVADPSCTGPADIGPSPTADQCAGSSTRSVDWYDEVEIDVAGALVRVPLGMRLDPGGIGKGLAADLVATELLTAGARGALVSVGGDLRAVGVAPDGSTWLVGIGHPNGDGEVEQLSLPAGGVATSGTLRRRWTASDGTPVHHLVDPATRAPIWPERGAPETVQASIVAVTAAWAEVMVKALLVKGTAAELPRLERLGVPACAITAVGGVVRNRSWDRLVVATPDAPGRAAS